jgi:hypothetical protein
VQLRGDAWSTEVHGDWLSSIGLAVKLAVRLSFGMGTGEAAGCTVRTMTNIDQGGTSTGARPERDMTDRPLDQVVAAEAVTGWFRAEAGWGPEAIERWLEGFWETQEWMDLIEAELVSRARTERSATSGRKFAS